MKLITRFIGMGLAVLALTGCFGGSGGSDSDSDPQQPAMSVDFTTFVAGEFADPNPDREPTKLNATTFSFNDQDNPQAFDDLLQ